jgi:hypothetical protein
VFEGGRLEDKFFFHGLDSTALHTARQVSICLRILQTFGLLRGPSSTLWLKILPNWIVFRNLKLNAVALAR